MDLRERLQGSRPEASAPSIDGFAELKDRIHMAVISDLGPRLSNAAVDDAALHQIIMADIRTLISQERGIAVADRDRLIQEIADDTIGHGPIEPLLQDDSVSEVMCNRPFDVWVESPGALHQR